MQPRETAMRHAFSDAVVKLAGTPGELSPERVKVAKRVVRIHGQGAGLRQPRAR